jgi:hypothetical protein
MANPFGECIALGNVLLGMGLFAVVVLFVVATMLRRE